MKEIDIGGPNKLLVAFTFYNKDHLQDHHFSYHQGSRTFKVLFILNFSFSSSFFSHSDFLLYDFVFSIFGFFYWNAFSLNWVLVKALQFLTCWWSLFSGILEKNYYFLAQRGYNGNIFFIIFSDEKKMATYHFKTWLPHSL